MSAKHQRTLKRIFEKPDRGDIPWKDIEGLFIAYGGEISQGAGSRVRVALGGVRAVFHRPHPKKEAHQALIRSVRRFLVEAGVKP